MGTPRSSPSLWLTAARDPVIAAALQSLFAEAADAIAARGPACWASGRCCNFEAAGHRLYTTALEAAYTLVRAGDSPSGDRPTARPSGEGGGGRLEALSLPQVAAARARGGCPFQARNLCTVHTIKPVACRVYFCDRSAQAWQHDLAEGLHQRVRGLHEAHSIPYHYAEWRSLLEMLASTT